MRSEAVLIRHNIGPTGGRWVLLRDVFSISDLMEMFVEKEDDSSSSWITPPSPG